MFWKQELVWLAVRASALPAVWAGPRECWIYYLGLCLAEKPAIPRKNPINSRKMQSRKVREETEPPQEVLGLLRLRGALHSLGTPAKNKQTGAELTQPHPGWDKQGKCRKTFLRAKGVSPWSCSRSDGHEASKARGLHGTESHGLICFDKQTLLKLLIFMQAHKYNWFWVFLSASVNHYLTNYKLWKAEIEQ